MKKSLKDLLEEIKVEFKIKKKQKYDCIAFSLVYWQRGYWNIKVTDDWHKWLDNKIELPEQLYNTPELACEEFLKYIKKNKIIISKLQSRD